MYNSVAASNNLVISYIQWYREGQMTILDDTLKALEDTVSSIIEDEEGEVERKDHALS